MEKYPVIVAQRFSKLQRVMEEKYIFSSEASPVGAREGREQKNVRIGRDEP
jgi:hypothetical protein